MKTLLYLIQVSACTGIFYLFYHLVLSRLTFFTINRWYLLTTLLISFIIPAITISENAIPQNYRVSPVSFSNISKIYVSNTPAINPGTDESFNWISLLPGLYFLVAGILAIYLLITLLILLKRINKGESVKTGNIKLLKGNKRYKNGSFFNCIFINDEALSPSELEQVVAHELIHIEEKHSVDKIISRLTQVVLWFNPFVYAYANAIDANHEYEVDHKIAQSSDKETYAKLILRLATSGNGPLYHHFSKFPLSKRIALLFNKPSKNMKKLIYILILPLIVVGCLFFANREFNTQSPDKSVGLAQYKISAIDNLEEDLKGLGKTPLVIIDKKEYDSEILYRISGRNIYAKKFILPDAAMKKYGKKAKDGALEISTEYNKIVYMTPIERENLLAEKSVSENQFYTRITLKNPDGSLFDKVIINMSRGGMSSTLEHNSKAAFIIDGKVYDEKQIAGFDQARVKSLEGGESGTGKASHFSIPGIDLTKYEVVFYFKENPMGMVGNLSEGMEIYHAINDRLITLANYIPTNDAPDQPTYALVGMEKLKRKFEIDLFCCSPDFKKADFNIWLNLMSGSAAALTPGTYGYTAKSANNRNAFEFSGSVKKGDKESAIAGGSLDVKFIDGNLIVQYDLLLKDGEKMKGTYNGKYQTADWRFI